jgi:Ca2+-binding RTX toxin-like protein
MFSRRPRLKSWRRRQSNGRNLARAAGRVQLPLEALEGRLLLSTSPRAIFVSNTDAGTIGEYSASGAPINASLISGLSYPEGIAVSGSDLFVVSAGLGTIAEYTTDGTPVNTSLVSGLSGADAIAVSGSDLFVVNEGGGYNGEYTTSGVTINARLITGLSEPEGIAVSGSNLLIGAGAPEAIAQFTTTGVQLNPTLVPGLNQPWGIAVSGNDMYVVDNVNGTIGEYTISGGTVDATLVSGLSSPQSIAISGTDLFVTNYNNGSGTIGEYTTSGATVNPALVSGLTNPVGISVQTPADISIGGGGVVTIDGTNSSDTIAGGVDPSDSSLYYFYIQSGGQPDILQTYPKSQVTGVQINGDPAGSTPSGADGDYINLGGANFGTPVSINGGAGSDTIIGQQLPNIITTGAGSSRNIVYGGIGNDSIVSQGFNDTMRAGGGHDTIRANTGNNVLAGGKNGSRLWAGNGHDTLRSGQGNSTLHGGIGGSILLGGFGDDVLDAGSGFDTLIAGSGQSTLNGGSSDDFLDAGWDAYLVLQGGDTLPTATGHDSVDGSAGLSDTLVASSGSPTLKGGSGNNVFAVNDPSATLQNVGSGFVAQDDTVSSATQTIKIHLTIADVNNGVTRYVVIPDGAGAAPSGTSAVEATSANGRIQFESSGPRTFTLGDFFNHWGVDFNAFGVGQFIASSGSGHTLSMTVNGVANTQLQNYAVQNGDNIVITFTQ